MKRFVLVMMFPSFQGTLFLSLSVSLPSLSLSFLLFLFSHHLFVSIEVITYYIPLGICFSATKHLREYFILYIILTFSMLFESMGGIREFEGEATVAKLTKFVEESSSFLLKVKFTK